MNKQSLLLRNKLNHTLFSKNKTKIVCTIGPASWNYSTLKQLAKAGMNVARLNFSHGSHAEKKEQIETIRQISQELNKPIAVMADLQGPKLRLGEIEGERQIKEGEIVQLSLSPISDELPIQFDLSPFVRPGHRIFLNDGLVELKVSEVIGKVIKTKALNSGVVSSHKGVNVPDTNLQGAAFTSKDFEDCVFALEQNVDYIALSFIQTPDDLKKVKALLKKYESKAKIIVKVEKKEAVERLEEIIKSSNAVMVARGDLAIEIEASEVPIVQQRIIKLARQYQKPVIIATQMLESMIENPRPTRAEVSDVASAVLDQADCVMLSAESASGKYPVEAVQTMHDIILSVEQNLEYKHYIKINWENLASDELHFNAITSAAASLAYRVHAKAIAVGTVTGRTARILASFRPDAKIIAVVHDSQTYNQLSLVWGVNPIIVDPSKNFDEFIENIFETLHELKLFRKEDKVVIVTGTTAGLSGTTNTIKVVTL